MRNIFENQKIFQWSTIISVIGLCAGCVMYIYSVRGNSSSAAVIQALKQADNIIAAIIVCGLYLSCIHEGRRLMKILLCMILFFLLLKCFDVLVYDIFFVKSSSIVRLFMILEVIVTLILLVNVLYINSAPSYSASNIILNQVMIVIKMIILIVFVCFYLFSGTMRNIPEVLIRLGTFFMMSVIASVEMNLNMLKKPKKSSHYHF